MNNKKTLVNIAAVSVLAFSFVFPSIVSAHSSGPGDTPNVWSGKLPGHCTLEYRPVHDAKGNIYDNACTAARDGIRVTWDGIHR